MKGVRVRQSNTADAAVDTRRARPATQVERFAAEALGTFLLVFIGGGTAALAALLPHNNHYTPTAAELLLVALAHGVALFVIVMVIGRISGAHVNPAVTIGLASVGQFDWGDVLLYLLGQIIGAIVGAFCIMIAYGKLAATVGHLGAPALATNTNLLQGMIIEGLGAGILVFAVMASAVDKHAPAGWAGLTIGLTLGAIIMFLGPATGAAVNPARALGPDLVSWGFGVNISWVDYLVCYLIGPILGGIGAAYLYRFIARLPKGVR
jgi:glycerol uptake facilitator protein